MHGMKTYIMQDDEGNIKDAYSISAGLDYPGIGPEHAYLNSIKRVKYDSVTDKEAINAFKLLCKEEGIIPALESSHAVAYAIKIAQNYKKDDVIIVEGIHALNPIITAGTDIDHVYKIYINASSRLVTENTGRVLLTKRDVRFVRRMIRDCNFRGSSVENTYFLWPGVRKGEDKFIFPFKKNADFFINTFHPFEPCLFRDMAAKLLDDIGEESIYSDEASRLRESISRFDSVDIKLLPEDSLLREFTE